MGQSGSGGKRQQGAAGSSRQSGVGSTSIKRQQSAQDIGKMQDEVPATGVRGRSNRQRGDLEGEEDIERPITHTDGDSDIESR